MSQQSTTYAPLVANCVEHATDDVETLFADAAGEHWKLEYLQLTAGPLRAWYRIVPLPDMTIHWYRCGAMLHVQEHHRHDGVYWAFVLSADGPFRWQGIELMPDQPLLYFPEQDHDYVLPRNSRLLGFMLSNRLIWQMGWNLRQMPTLHIDPHGIPAVAAEAARVTTAVHQGIPPGEEGLEIMQERLVMHLEKLIEPGLSDSGSGETKPLGPDKLHRLAESARREMIRLDLSEKLDVRRLAATLFTSTRNLYRAFRHCYGVGPYEYHTLMRFRAFRNLVRSTDTHPGVITDMALATGFTHLGRFAAAYRKQYGELPSDTLRRWLQNPVHPNGS